MKSKRKIRNFLIDKAQLGFSLKYSAVGVFASVLTIIVIYISVWPVVMDYTPQAIIKELWVDIIERLVLFGIPMIVLMIIISIVISHRIMGPLYKIGKQLDKIIRGESDELIRIRKNDALKPLVEKLNKLIVMLRKKR